MRVKFAAAAIAMLASFGCAANRQAIPGAPAPDAALAERSGKPVTQLQQGYAVYMLKCGECHERKLPDEIPGSRWHAVVPGMAWNAGLSSADEDALLAYLTAVNTKR